MWYHSISLHMHWLTYPALSSLLTQLRILITTILTSCNNRGHPLLAFRKNAGVKRFTCYLKNGHLLYTVYGSTWLWSFLLKSLYIALYFFPFLHSTLYWPLWNTEANRVFQLPFISGFVTLMKERVLGDTVFVCVRLSLCEFLIDCVWLSGLKESRRPSAVSSVIRIAATLWKTC